MIFSYSCLSRLTHHLNIEYWCRQAPHFVWPERGCLREECEAALTWEQQSFTKIRDMSLGVQDEAALVISLSFKKICIYSYLSPKPPAIKCEFWLLMNDRRKRHIWFRWKYIIWKRESTFLLLDAALNLSLIRIISTL